ncbi:MAG: DUF1919 domain-containing protein [Prevotellaceae bacterium]|nr:DUF1919 domain-containing protein [Candidatus Colivivens equi]
MVATGKYYWLRKIYRKVHRFFLQKRLKNHDFTLLAPTCIAGVIYHELGMQFLSPTINLWMYDKDFVQFVGNLKYYLSQKLRFVKIEGEVTPTAYLDDILIHFNHYHTEEEAAFKWYERCKRVNYDNLYVIMADQPDGGVVTHEDMLSLKRLPLRNKAVLSIREYEDIDYIVHLPKDPVKDCVNMYMFDKSKILARYRWERVWNYVKWINQGVQL